MEDIQPLFSDLDTPVDRNCDCTKESKPIHELIIEKIDIESVLNGDKERYNTNNIWIGDNRPDDYEHISDMCKTSRWIDSFRDTYTVINIPIVLWMRDALNYGKITRQISSVNEEDITDYLEKYETQKIRDLFTDNRYFVRSEKVSLKRGIHRAGPYTSLKQIIESLITTDDGHSVLTDEHFKSGTLKLYLFDWIEMNEHKEFRVFVKERNITAISQQSLYTRNTILANLSDTEREHVIRKWVDIITDYFDTTIVNRLDSNSYCIDFAILDDNSPYFIEINPFGKEYSSGSSLYGWLQDEDILYGKKKHVYFRYTY